MPVANYDVTCWFLWICVLDAIGEIQVAENLIIGKGERGHAPFTAVFFFPQSVSMYVYSSFKEASSLTSIPFLFFRSFLDDGMQVT